MFDKIKVISGLSGVVGWRQPLDPSAPTLDASNLATSSGYTFDENAFVKISSLKASQDYAAISDVDFNKFLKELQSTAIANVVNSIFDRSDYIDRQVLYRYANNKKVLEELPDGFVGYEIQMVDNKDYAFEISRVLLEFSGTGDIELMLFNSANPDPVESKVISITSTIQSEVLNWKIDNSDSYYKGKYFLGYVALSHQLVVPFARDYKDSGNMSRITGMYIMPMAVSGHATNKLFDLDDVEYAGECWGLNPDITVFDDFTDLIIQNKTLFAKAIQMQGQVEAISLYIAAVRSNKTERQTTANVNKMIVELDGIDADVRIVGLRQKLYGELGRIRKEIQKLRRGYHTLGMIVNTR